MSGVIGAIIEKALAGPEHPAVKDASTELTYKELLGEVERHATGLAERGVRVGDRVAILMPNSVEFVVAALSCLWLGAIFVPLSPSDPETRRSLIIDDCKPALVIVPGTGKFIESATVGQVATATLDSLRHDGDLIPVVDVELRACYIIYTSGTTGTPKGVLINDSAFAAALESTVAALGLNRNTRTLCVSPFHFDGSYATLFATLFAGGSVHIRSREELLFPRAFFNTIDGERITHTGFTPSYLRLLLSSGQTNRLGDSTLDSVALGGEAASAADVLALMESAPTLRVFNRYGPTETTIAVTHTQLEPEKLAEGIVTIGQPHPNVSFVLVDGDVVVDDANHVGELYISGVQLMEGYWNDPALSQTVLRDDLPTSGRAYRSGDLMYRDDNGDYLYVNRADRVIKRSGVRISLVEIDEAIRQLPHVVASASLLFDDEGASGIASFVVAEQALTTGDLFAGIKKFLPETMVPDRVELVASLPMTGSNKLDERNLLASAGLRPYRISEPQP